MRDASRLLTLLMADALIDAVRNGDLDLTDPRAVAAELRAQRFGAGAILAFGQQARETAHRTQPALAARPILRAAE